MTVEKAAKEPERTTTKMNKRIALALFALAALALDAHGQNRSSFAGQSVALDFAYGVNATAPGALVITSAPATTGAGTITLSNAFITLADGTTLCPLNVNAPVNVGNGSNQEKVTPTGVSCGTPNGNNATITATFANLHGGDSVATATFGLQEAINYRNGIGGGIVAVTTAWASAGGTAAILTAAAPFSNVSIIDTRTGYQNWGVQPTTLTSMAVPPTLVAGTVVFAAAPVGTWANSAYYFCVTYVDMLGGEGPCSLTYNQTPTLNYSVTITAPAASTGAVGWRFYAGASYNAAYLMPIDATHCVLTTLESVMPACAMGANGGWIAPPLTTTSLRPNATVTTGALASPTVNISATQPQGHTTFSYQPTAAVPQPFQTHYGPFPAYGSTTSGQVDTLGSINLPAGFLNVIGRTVRLRGKLSLGTVNTAALPTITVLLSWVAGTTAGVGVTTCSLEGVAAGATKTYNGQLDCELNTNAIGATAVGSIMPSGYLLLQAQDISAAGLGPYVDTNTAAVGSLGLFAQNTINIVYTSTTNTTTAPVLLGLDVDVIQ